jgi:hypothetical protein
MQCNIGRGNPAMRGTVRVVAKRLREWLIVNESTA